MSKKEIILNLLLSISILLGVQSCSSDDMVIKNEKIHYIDVDVIVVEKGDIRSDGTDFHYFFIKKVNEPLYFKWSYVTWNDKKISDKKFYQTSVGDTLHFDYIAKKRFFRVDDPTEILKTGSTKKHEESKKSKK